MSPTAIKLRSMLAERPLTALQVSKLLKVSRTYAYDLLESLEKENKAFSFEGSYYTRPNPVEPLLRLFRLAIKGYPNTMSPQELVKHLRSYADQLERIYEIPTEPEPEPEEPESEFDDFA